MKKPFTGDPVERKLSQQLFVEQVDEVHTEPYYSDTTRTRKLVYPRNYLPVNCPVHGDTYAARLLSGVSRSLQLACGCVWNDGGGIAEGWWRDEDCEWLTTQQLKERLRAAAAQQGVLPEASPLLAEPSVPVRPRPAKVKVLVVKRSSAPASAPGPRPPKGLFRG